MFEYIQAHLFDLESFFMSSDIDWAALFLLVMTPIFFVAFFAEYIYKKIKGDTSSFVGKEILANYSLGISYQAVEAIAAVVVGGVALDFFYQYRFFDIPINAWTAIPLFFLVDLTFYWMHRTSHRVRWFWTAHVPHHSGKNMNFSTAARQSVLNAVVGAWVFYVPMALIGVSPVVIGLLLSINLAYQYFIHTETIRKLPAWFEWFFNTPSHHRVHHGRNPRYIDKNYGGTFIIFDRLLGTFEPESEEVIYGITHQVETYNPIILNIHEFVDLIRDVASPGPIVERFKHLIMPPDWTRSGHEPVRTWPVTVHPCVDTVDTITPNHKVEKVSVPQ